MLLLIDAYNLLHLSDQLWRQRSEGWLARARDRLVGVLAQHLGPELCQQTCLVFDAKQGRKSTPGSISKHGIELLFAVDHDEADDLLEEIIARHATPKRLMVVSSDHRIQRAASRRGARFMDADVWYSELVEKGPRLAVAWPPQKSSLSKEATNLPSDDPAEAELMENLGDATDWLDKFSLEDEELLEVEPLRRPTEPPKKTEKAKLQREPPETPKRSEKGNRSVGRKKRKDPSDKPTAGQPIDPGLANPFPKGYGEDLLE